MKCLFLFLLCSICYGQFNEYYAEEKLIDAVKRDMNRLEINWQFQALRGFPTCKGCSSLLPCCLNANKYGAFNFVYKSEKYKWLVGVRYWGKNAVNYSIINYIYDGKNWTFADERRIIVENTMGEIIKDCRDEQ